MFSKYFFLKEVLFPITVRVKTQHKSVAFLLSILQFLKTEWAMSAMIRMFKMPQASVW